MTTLTSSDFTKIKTDIRNDSASNNVFKAWGLDKPTWKSLLQETEDYFVDAFNVTPSTSYKTAVDAITTITNAQAQMIFKSWASWKSSDL